ncbi:MAG: FapA family protein [Deltaproteobacteria bacterium]|nr:FapA family protein [Deltaproteobacteria bacterium]
MPYTYYLRHYFDPDMDHLALKPRVSSGDEADRYNLGYVQNTINGQVLAEVVPLTEIGNTTLTSLNPRFFLAEPVLPQGPNTRIDPRYPQYLLADANGYVFYHEGAITVKKLLNVRGDVDFHTGNIFFVGDMAVHGNVRAGFEVQANRILIKGMVEGGVVRARTDLALQGGARGGVSARCLLSAGGDLRLPFVEKAELRAGNTIYVERTCQHATVFAGSNLVVKDRLQGGVIHARSTIYVANQLGTSTASPTAIYLGYNAPRIRQLEKLDARMDELATRVAHYTAVAGHLPPDATPTTRKLAMGRQKLEVFRQRREQLWATLAADERLAGSCRLVVPGTVYPGVEVSIGRAFLTVESVYRNVVFQLQGDEVIITPNTPGANA